MIRYVDIYMYIHIYIYVCVSVGMSVAKQNHAMDTCSFYQKGEHYHMDGEFCCG